MTTDLLWILLYFTLESTAKWHGHYPCYTLAACHFPRLLRLQVPRKCKEKNHVSLMYQSPTTAN